MNQTSHTHANRARERDGQSAWNGKIDGDEKVHFGLINFVPILPWEKIYANQTCADEDQVKSSQSTQRILWAEQTDEKKSFVSISSVSDD